MSVTVDARGRSVRLRPAAPEDEAFLFELYASTRADEMAAWGWDAAQRERFLRMQYAARRQYYQSAFPRADHRVVEVDGRPAGRILVARGAEEVRLTDVALLPENRGAGVGEFLVRELQREAAAAGLPVTLHVAEGNPALRLYERLGFRTTGDDGVYLAMTWTPDPDQSARP